jgi:hypothetical protein
MHGTMNLKFEKKLYVNSLLTFISRSLKPGKNPVPIEYDPGLVPDLF